MTVDSAIPVNRNLLLVSDSEEELENLQHLLGPEFGRFMKTLNAEEGLQLFEKYHPTVLLLAFAKVEDAERFRQLIDKDDADMSEVSHQTLLFCRASESARAYALCRNGAIEDYVADRPLYDPFQLILSVAHALHRRSHEKYAQLLKKKIAKFDSGLQQFEKLMNELQSAKAGIPQDSIRAFSRFTQQLSSDLDELEDSLLELGSVEMPLSASKEKIKQQFERVGRDALRDSSKHVVEQLLKTDELLDQYSNGFEKYRDTAHEVTYSDEGIQVMLVDDDEFYRDTLAEVLKEANMEVFGVGDGKTAISCLEHSRPNVILLDYRMPGVDGMAVLRWLKSTPNTQHIPVIMLTGVSDWEFVNSCKRAGASGFIVKPGDRNTVLAKIRLALGVEAG